MIFFYLSAMFASFLFDIRNDVYNAFISDYSTIKIKTKLILNDCSCLVRSNAHCVSHQNTYNYSIIAIDYANFIDNIWGQKLTHNSLKI